MTGKYEWIETYQLLKKLSMMIATICRSLATIRRPSATICRAIPTF